jgi:nitrate/nitrite transporter NarK
VDPEFQRVLLRVMAIGGIIGVIGTIGVYLAFRSFGESAAARRSRGPILFIVLGFIVVCCLVLLRMSPEVR